MSGESLLFPNPTAAADQAPTVTDRLQGANFVRELGKVAHRPDEIVFARAAQLMRDHRVFCRLAEGATFRAAQSEVDARVREAATVLLVSLHMSVGHVVPAEYARAQKPLQELLNDLEEALCLRVVPATEAPGLELTTESTECTEKKIREDKR